MNASGPMCAGGIEDRVGRRSVPATGLGMFSARRTSLLAAPTFPTRAPASRSLSSMASSHPVRPRATNAPAGRSGQVDGRAVDADPRPARSMTLAHLIRREVGGAGGGDRATGRRRAPWIEPTPVGEVRRRGGPAATPAAGAANVLNAHGATTDLVRGLVGCAASPERSRSPRARSGAVMIAVRGAPGRNAGQRDRGRERADLGERGPSRWSSRTKDVVGRDFDQVLLGRFTPSVRKTAVPPVAGERQAQTAHTVGSPVAIDDDCRSRQPPDISPEGSSQSPDQVGSGPWPNVWSMPEAAAGLCRA